MREDSLARTHAGETNGNVILEYTQPDPPLVVGFWLPERQRHGSPGSARPGAAAPSLYQGQLRKRIRTMVRGDMEMTRKYRDPFRTPPY